MIPPIMLKLVGGLSDVSKMPGLSFGLPTKNCITGEKLARKKGTICAKCYAKRGYYAIFAKRIVAAQERRLKATTDPQWIDNMVSCIRNELWFRWFDSGDLQSLQMLLDIIEVARRTPNVRHWLATRERSFVRSALKRGPLPENLTIRISVTYPDVPVKPIPGVQEANVHKHKPPVGFECRAPKQRGKCDTCRACWDSSIQTVSYKEH